MQPNPSASLTWSQFALGAASFITGILASLVAYFGFRLNKRKLPAEIHESETRSNLNVAQAQSLALKDSLSAGDLLSRIFDQLAKANDRNLEVNQKYQEALDELQAAQKEIARIPAMEIQVNILRLEVERARREGFLKRESEGGIGPNPAAGNPT